MYGGWLDLLYEKRDDDETVRLPVLSGSMLPRLVPGKSVEIRPLGGMSYRTGDILVIRQERTLIAHRLLFRISFPGPTRLYQKGDYMRRGGWAAPDQVVGIVIGAEDGSGAFIDFRTRSERRKARRIALHQLIRCMFWTAVDGLRGRRRYTWDENG